MITRTLTGVTRFREEKRWFKPSLLILQVEEHLKGYVLDPHGTTDIDECRFRDLRVCDLQIPAAISNWPLLQK